MLAALGVHVIPQQLALSQARAAFDEAGELVDSAQAAALSAIAQALVETTAKLTA